jgi:hypothetical protein
MDGIGHWLRRADVQIAALCVAVALVLGLTYFGFRPPYHHYLPMIHLAQHPGAFALDPVLAGSVYLQASVYYKLVHRLALPITNDVFGLALHLALNAALVWLTYRAARRHLGLVDPVQALTLAFIACFFYSKFVEGAVAAPISFNTPTPTGLAHLAGMAALLLLLERQFLVAAALAALSVAVAPKGNVLIVPGLALYMLIDRGVPRRALIWSLIPIGYVAWRALAPPTAPMSAAEASELIRFILVREEGDALLAEQRWPAWVLLAASFALFPLLARQFESRALRWLGWAFWIVTLAAVAVDLIYPLLYRQYPLPLLAMVAIPLAAKHFLFLFGAMVAAWLLSAPRLAECERLAALLGFVVLKAAAPQFIVAALIVLVGVGLLRLVPRLRKVWLPPVPLTLAVVLGAFVIARSGVSYLGPSWVDHVAYRHTGNWSAGVFAEAAAWQAWKALARRTEDFPLLAVYRRESGPEWLSEGPFMSHTWPHLLSGKSPFATIPASAYLDLKLWYEAQRRWEIRETILERLNAGRPIDATPLGRVTIRKERLPLEIDDTLTGFLAKRKVRILAPISTAHLFPADAPQERIGGYVLVRFGG